MGRRRQGDEIAFGSDSFLDIVANIVGILIILIVIAGVRVSKLPVVSREAATPDVAPQASAAAVPDVVPPVDLPAEQSPLPELPPVDEMLTALDDEPEPDEPPPAPEPPPLSPDLVQKVQELEQAIQELQQRQQQLTSQEETLATARGSVRQQLSITQERLEEKREVVSRGRTALKTHESDLESKLRELATLQVTLAEAEAAEPEPTVLKHKLSPVGREVSQDAEEVHFLLSGGRVAVVPINELADELKSHIERKKHQILRMQRYVGTVGPVSGFRMGYVVERRMTTLIEELRMGATVISAGLSHWQIYPQPDVITETASQALHPHGRFLTALRRADRNATLTFWVYPDSFSLHRELLEYAHDQGFEVAARPLPEGIPITGSPQGSRSVAQ